MSLCMAEVRPRRLTGSDLELTRILRVSVDRARGKDLIVGTSQAAKVASHDRILGIASARIRRDGIDNLRVAVGAVAGLLPALRAAGIAPTEALWAV
jgi:hypothetical protein